VSAPTDPSRSGPPRSSVKSGLEEVEGAAPRPRRDPKRRLAVLGRLGLVVVLLLAVAGTVYLTSKRSEFGRDDAGAEEIPALEVAPAPVQLGTVAQPDALAVPGTEALAAPQRGPARPTAPLRPAQGRASMASWANGLSARVGIPARALMAYGIADLTVRAENPGCHLSWVTVAGLARIESNHGRYRGATIAANGRVEPPIVGVPLDGTSGNRVISDTDGGVLDGDATLDRAVGPFQFIPSTWRTWRSDGNGDGVADPDNIDDSSLAAGRYLCANGRDLATGEGWREAVLSYNQSDEYGRRVYAAANQYAAASRA
jgi:membrane-bound lytic murein transglycosylase B